jgi:hypothetical protein
VVSGQTIKIFDALASSGSWTKQALFFHSSSRLPLNSHGGDQSDFFLEEHLFRQLIIGPVVFQELQESCGCFRVEGSFS